jgi:TP901 family phage tail tape measure protein
MAPRNQATITLAVNVQNMAGLRSLTTGLTALKTQIMAIQRSPAMRAAGGMQTPAQQFREAASAARQQANLQASQIKGAAQVQAAQQRAAVTAVQGQTAMARAAQAGARALGIVAGAHRNAGSAAQGQARNLVGLSQSLSNAEHQVDALWRASFRLQMLGSQIKRFGENIISGLVGSAQAFGDFEFKALRAGAAMELFQTNARTTEVNSRDLQRATLDLGQELRFFPAEEVAEAVYFWGSTTGQTIRTQQDLHNVMKSLEPVMKTAVMTETSYEAAIKGVYSIMTQYYGTIVRMADEQGNYTRMSALSEEIMQRLFFITQKTAIEFSDLIQSFKMVGPVAGALGVSFGEMAEFLGRLADVGLRGTMAGRSFRQMFIQISRPSGPALKALDALFSSFERGSDQFREFQGKSWSEIIFPKGEFVGLESYIRTLAVATKDLTTQERVAFLARISTANMLPTLIALIGQETDAINGLSRSTKTAGADMDDMRKYFNDTWDDLKNSTRGTMMAFERAIESIKITIGAGVVDAFKPMIQMVTDFLVQVRKWIEQNPELVRQLAQVAGAIGGVLVVLGTLLITLGSVIAMFAGAFLVIKGFGGYIGSHLLPMFRGLGVGLSLVVGIAEGIARNWAMLQTRFEEVGQNIQAAIDNVTSAFADGGGDILSFGQVMRTVADIIIDVGSQVVLILSRVIKAISEFGPAVDMFKMLVPIVVNFFAAFTVLKIASIVTALLKLNGVLKVLWVTMLQGQLANAFRTIGAGMAASVASTSALSGAVGKLTAAFRLFLIANPLVVLAAVAGFAFAAYQNNWFGFKSMVDGVTTSFRNLQEEFDNTWAKLKGADKIESVFKNAFDMGDIWTKKDQMKGATFEVPFIDDAFIQKTRNSYREVGDIWNAATYGARTHVEAMNNVFKELNDMGLEPEVWSRGFTFATDRLKLTAVEATRFGQAYAEAMRDGEATTAEFIKEYTKLGGSAADIDNLTAGMLRYLKVTPQAVEVTDKWAESLLAALNAPVLEGVFEGLNPAMLYSMLRDRLSAMSPRMQEIVESELETWMAGGGEVLQEGWEDALNEFQPNVTEVDTALRNALLEMGKTKVPTEMFEGLVSTITEAARSAGEGADYDAIARDAISGLGDSFENLDKWIRPSLEIAATGLADSIKTAFSKKENLKTAFRDALKEVIPDKKGIAQLFEAFTDPKLAEALRGDFGIMGRAIALTQVQEVTTAFNNAWDVATPQQRDSLAEQFRSIFDVDLLEITETAFAKLDPAMQQAAAQIMFALYEHLKVPVPDWLVTFIEAQAGSVPATAQAAMDDFVFVAPELPAPTMPDFVPLQSAWNRQGEYFETAWPTSIAAPTVTVDGQNITGVWDQYKNLSFNIEITIGSTDTQTPPVGSPSTTVATSAVNSYVGFVSGAITGTNTQTPPVVAPSTGAAVTAVSNYTGFVTRKISGLSENAYTWGLHLGQRYARGISAAEGKVTKAAVGLARSAAKPIKFSSPPSIGPLKHIDEYARHMVERWAGTIVDSAPRAERAGMVVAAAASRGMRDEILSAQSDMSGKLSYEGSNKRTVDINIKVSSPDGSVNRTTLSEIRKATMEGIALGQVEHMVTIE